MGFAPCVRTSSRAPTFFSPTPLEAYGFEDGHCNRKIAGFRSTSALFRPAPGITRGDVLQFRITFALSRAVKIVRGLRQGLTEAERYAVADQVVAQLKERGDPWQLEDEAKPGSTPTT